MATKIPVAQNHFKVGSLAHPVLKAHPAIELDHTGGHSQPQRIWRAL